MVKKIDLERLTLISNEIETLVKETGIDFIDACITYCTKHNIEIEMLGEILKKNQRIKNLIQEEAENLNFMKKENRVEFE